MRKGENENWDVRIDRKSVFGNPFEEKVYGREECIRLYKIYFIKKMRDNGEFRKAVEGLHGKVLGCWCKPKACHGDVIMEYLKTGNVKTFPKEV